MGSDRLGILAQVRLRIPLLVVGGVLGALAFPRTDWWLFAWAWLAPALCCALARSPLLSETYQPRALTAARPPRQRLL